MSYVTVIVTYKGKPLSKPFKKEHPEIDNLYPSLSVFYSIYLPLLNKARETKVVQTLEISENCIKINGIEITVS